MMAKATVCKENRTKLTLTTNQNWICERKQVHRCLQAGLYTHSHSCKRTTHTLQAPFSLTPLNLSIYFLLTVYQQKQKLPIFHPWVRVTEPSTFPSILFVHTWRITDPPMLQQMGTLYTLELSTNSGLNECRSTEATLTQQWNVAIVCSEGKYNRVLCLNPISSVSFHFYIRRGLKDQWSRYRFPRSIF